MYQSLALLLSGTALTVATSLSVPSTIAAGTSVSVKFTPSSTDFDSYRIYLAMTPPGWGTGPACYLVNDSSISTLTNSITIPASVGPSSNGEDYYSLSYMYFNSDPNAVESSSGLGYSSTFSLTGGTGAWSEYETSGYSVGNADDLPCTAYDCARQCYQTNYPSDVNDSETDLTGVEAAYKCFAACPGVNVASWDSVISAQSSYIAAESSYEATATGAQVTVGGSTMSMTADPTTTLSTKTTSAASVKSTGSAAVAQQTTATTSASKTSGSASTSGTATGTAASSTAITGAGPKRVAVNMGALFVGVGAIFAAVNL